MIVLVIIHHIIFKDFNAWSERQMNRHIFVIIILFVKIGALSVTEPSLPLPLVDWM